MKVRDVNDLIEFLTKCNDEDEAAARPLEFSDSVVWRVFAITQTDQEVGSHIALHDPARVLRECAARREMFAGCLVDGWHRCDHGDLFGPDEVCRGRRFLLASFADRPGFKDEWRVT